MVQQETDDSYIVNFINKSVNTNNNETDPLLIDFKDERYLYFTRKPLLEESNDEDIFVGVEKKNFVFSDIVPLPFNTKGKPEAVSYVSAKEPITLIYYGHYGSDLRGNLYISTFNNNWSEPVKLSFPVNTNNFELLHLNEPHKHRQNSFTIIKKSMKNIFPFDVNLLNNFLQTKNSKYLKKGSLYFVSLTIILISLGSLYTGFLYNFFPIPELMILSPARSTIFPTILIFILIISYLLKKFLALYI